MVSAQGWCRKPHRAKVRRCRVASYGMTYRHIGDKPLAVTLNLVHAFESLYLEFEHEEVVELAAHFKDFLAREAAITAKEELK